MKITLQGEWRTGQVWLDGREVKPAHCRLAFCPRHSRFSWGSRESGAGQLALAILLQFVRPEKAIPLCEAFTRDFIAEIPQADFKTRIDVGRWLTREQAERRKAG